MVIAAVLNRVLRTATTTTPREPAASSGPNSPSMVHACARDGSVTIAIAAPAKGVENPIIRIADLMTVVCGAPMSSEITKAKASIGGIT